MLSLWLLASLSLVKGQGDATCFEQCETFECQRGVNCLRTECTDSCTGEDTYCRVTFSNDGFDYNNDCLQRCGATCQTFYCTLGQSCIQYECNNTCANEMAYTCDQEIVKADGGVITGSCKRGNSGGLVIDQNADREVCYYSACDKGQNCEQALCEFMSADGSGNTNTCSQTYEQDGEVFVNNCEDLDECAQRQRHCEYTPCEMAGVEECWIETCDSDECFEGSCTNWWSIDGAWDSAECENDLCEETPECQYRECDIEGTDECWYEFCEACEETECIIWANWGENDWTNQVCEEGLTLEYLDSQDTTQQCEQTCNLERCEVDLEVADCWIEYCTGCDLEDSCSLLIEDMNGEWTSGRCPDDGHADHAHNCTEPVCEYFQCENEYADDCWEEICLCGDVEECTAYLLYGDDWYQDTCGDGSGVPDQTCDAEIAEPTCEYYECNTYGDDAWECWMYGCFTCEELTSCDIYIRQEEDWSYLPCPDHYYEDNEQCDEYTCEFHLCDETNADDCWQESCYGCGEKQCIEFVTYDFQVYQQECGMSAHDNGCEPECTYEACFDGEECWLEHCAFCEDMECTKYSKVNDEWQILECAAEEAYPADWFEPEETCFTNQCYHEYSNVCEVDRCVNEYNDVTFCEQKLDFGEGETV